MSFMKSLFVGIGKEVAHILRTLRMLRWQAWTAWALLFPLALAGIWPSNWMLGVQSAVLLGLGSMALFSGRVAALVRRRRWVRLPDGREVVPYLPQLVLLSAFPLFFTAMTVLFWKAAQLDPTLLPAASWGEALRLATYNFVRCQLFFDAAEIFHISLGVKAKPSGLYGPSLLLVSRVIMDVVFLKLAFQLVLAGYYRARGLGRGEDNLVHLRDALASHDAPRVQQLSEAVRRALWRTVDLIAGHLDPRGGETPGSQRAWLSLRAMKDFALPYLEDRLRGEDKADESTDEGAPPLESAPGDVEETRQLQSVVRRLRDSQVVTDWRQIESTFPVRRWPFIPLALAVLGGTVLPLALNHAGWGMATACTLLLLAAWLLLDARRWINVLLRMRVIQPYWPTSLPWVLARWSLALAPLLIASAAAMFYYLEELLPGNTFTTFNGEPLVGRLAVTSAFNYVADNLLRTNIFFDTFEVYDLKPTRIETYDPLGCTLTLLTRMIFDLGFISLWVSVLGLRFNQMFGGGHVRPHMDLKIQIEAQENGIRSARFVLYYYGHIREFFLQAMYEALDERKLLAALGYSGFLSALKQQIDGEPSDRELNARHRANLGFALTMQDRLQEAIDEERLAVQMLEQLDRQGHPDAAKDLGGAKLDLAVAHENQQRWNAAQTRYYEAIEVFERLVREGRGDVDADFAYTLNCLAWLLATCPDGRFRDGVKAVQFAERACALTKWDVIDYIDTLAAAYAEAGDFNRAIGLQQTVCEDPADKADQADFESRLELYLDGKPFHRGK